MRSAMSLGRLLRRASSKASDLLTLTTGGSVGSPSILDGEIIYSKNNVCVHAPEGLQGPGEHHPGEMRVRYPKAGRGGPRPEGPGEASQGFPFFCLPSPGLCNLRNQGPTLWKLSRLCWTFVSPVAILETLVVSRNGAFSSVSVLGDTAPHCGLPPP